MVGRQRQPLAAYSDSNQPTALTIPLPIQSSEEKLDCFANLQTDAGDELGGNKMSIRGKKKVSRFL